MEPLTKLEDKSSVSKFLSNFLPNPSKIKIKVLKTLAESTFQDNQGVLFFEYQISDKAKSSCRRGRFTFFTWILISSPS